MHQPPPLHHQTSMSLQGFQTSLQASEGGSHASVHATESAHTHAHTHTQTHTHTHVRARKMVGKSRHISPLTGTAVEATCCGNRSQPCGHSRLPGYNGNMVSIDMGYHNTPSHSKEEAHEHVVGVANTRSPHHTHLEKGSASALP